MDSIYWIIITALLLLAAFDLINGVANDAVNFLNSAIGSKAAPVRVILTVASIGVLVGACFSGGMMEVARNGIFHPDMFSYHEVMLLFLGVMISEVILLDTFNTFGLPTSTTVSLVFGILGSAVATALFKISKLRLVQSVWDFINTDKAFEIVTSILLSVAIAFTVGTIVMWISRLAFTFKYQSRFKWFGCFWCGIAMTAIAYFAVFKGLKESTLMEPSFIQYIDQNLGMALLTAFGGFSVLMFLLQHLFMTNILRLTVLAGTFSLALAFAGNDLVNFIGVFMGGLDSFQYASSVAAAGGSPSSITSMECLMPGQGMPVNHYILFAAGCMMIFALWFSKKAKTVIATGVELSRQGEGGIERFGSVPPARAIVRSAIALGRGVKRLIPARMLVRMNHQWDPAPQPLNPKDRVDSRHGEPDGCFPVDCMGYWQAAPSFHHVRDVHGGDGLLSGGQGMGKGERGLPYNRRADGDFRLVHDRAGCLYAGRRHGYHPALRTGVRHLRSAGPGGCHSGKVHHHAPQAGKQAFRRAF